MPDEIDELLLEEISDLHDIGVRMFVPFAIARLSTGSDATSAVLDVTIEHESEGLREQKKLRLVWSADTDLSAPVAASPRVVTELAACGVASVIVSKYTGYRLTAVADDGDRFDYWITDGQSRFGLEVSGTLGEDLTIRHREKVRQLQKNPHRIGGVVVVVGFTTKEAVISFHPLQENAK